MVVRRYLSNVPMLSFEGYFALLLVPKYQPGTIVAEDLLGEIYLRLFVLLDTPMCLRFLPNHVTFSFLVVFACLAGRQDISPLIWSSLWLVQKVWWLLLPGLRTPCKKYLWLSLYPFSTVGSSLARFHLVALRAYVSSTGSHVFDPHALLGEFLGSKE